MISLHLTGRHFELDKKIVAYADRKIGGLDRYLARNARPGLQAHVVLECDESHTTDTRNICEVHFEVKGERFQAKEAALNMYACIDICEAKLKRQLHDYKSKHDVSKNRKGRLLGKILGRQPEEI